MTFLFDPLYVAFALAVSCGAGLGWWLHDRRELIAWLKARGMTLADWKAAERSAGE